MEITRINPDGEPEFVEDIRSIQWIKDIEKQHKTAFVKAFAKFIHFLFKKDGLYSNYSEKERITLIDDEVLGEIKSDSFFADGNCTLFIARLRNSLMSEPEKFLDKTKEALNELSEKIRSIPMEKKGFYEQEIAGPDGTFTKVKVEVMVENSAEFLKSMKMSEDIFDYQDKLKKRIAEQNKKVNKKRDPGMRLFDEE